MKCIECNEELDEILVQEEIDSTKVYLCPHCEADITEQDKILNDPSIASEYAKIQSAIDQKAILEENYFELLEEQETLERIFE